jgi:hypothetical protein
MLSLENRIKAFAELGTFLIKIGTVADSEELILKEPKGPELLDLIKNGHLINPWFTPENLRQAIVNLGESMAVEKLEKWMNTYKGRFNNRKTANGVGVVMAGNIPLVGFHDFLCVLMSGNRLIARLSSDDNKLLPAIAKRLVSIEPGFAEYIYFTEEKLEKFDAVIATGSNNSARYFEYYFGRYPHIIRKNRNGVAVLTGRETVRELHGLGLDIFTYFGLGCRSVSKLFVPKDFPFHPMFESFNEFKYIGDHYKYNNNYEYYKSIFLINGLKHFDNGFLLVTEEGAYSSPPSVLYFEEYNDIKALINRLYNDSNQIQCIVSHAEVIPGAIPFGYAQKPEVWDYADGIDTMEFLLNL